MLILLFYLKYSEQNQELELILNQNVKFKSKSSKSFQT